MIPVVLLVTVISFAVIYLSPGDPVTIMLSQGGASVDENVASAMRAELGLDRPVVEQYFDWLFGMVQGDFGTSIISGRPVLTEIGVRLPATLFLAAASMVLTLALSIPLGFLAALKQNRFADYVVRFLTFAGAAIPGFLAALLLIYLFAINLGWLPSIGSLSGNGWVLPVLTLALCETAVFTRQIRTAVLQELDKDYVNAARMRGVKESTLMAKGVLKAVLPTIFILTGMAFGQLLGGTAIIETIFSWPGVGQYAVQEVFARDYPVIQGYVFLMAFVFLIINLLVDIAQSAVDPRTQEQLERKRALR